MQMLEENLGDSGSVDDKPASPPKAAPTTTVRRRSLSLLEDNLDNQKISSSMYLFLDNVMDVH